MGMSEDGRVVKAKVLRSFGNSAWVRSPLLAFFYEALPNKKMGIEDRIFFAIAKKMGIEDNALPNDLGIAYFFVIAKKMWEPHRLC